MLRLWQKKKILQNGKKEFKKLILATFKSFFNKKKTTGILLVPNPRKSNRDPTLLWRAGMFGCPIDDHWAKTGNTSSGSEMATQSQTQEIKPCTQKAPHGCQLRPTLANLRGERGLGQNWHRSGSAPPVLAVECLPSWQCLPSSPTARVLFPFLAPLPSPLLGSQTAIFAICCSNLEMRSS